MAQKVKVSFVDDLDGSEAEGTVTFSLDGRTFDIDLSAANASRLRDLLATYVAAGRRAGGSGRATSRPATAASDREQNQAIREWAESQGMAIAARGRISAEIVAAYRDRDKAVAAPSPEPAVEEAPAKKPRKRSTVAQPVFSGG